MPKLTKTRTARRSPAKPAPKKTTALAVRKPAALKKPVKVQVLPPEPSHRNLTDDIMLGELGLVEMTLTEKEETVLSEAVNPARILVKPQGQPYLPHIEYRRWFDRAFGRLGWALVPVGKPAKAATGKKITVVVPYVLHVHGRPVKFAWGEQDYYEDNAEQTYGDALESTDASAMRRVAKKLGVGLEMWDRAYLEDWLDTNCRRVKVSVKKRNGDGNEDKWLWRRRADKPFWNEVGHNPREAQEEISRRRDEGGRVSPDDRMHHGREGEKITLAQRQRLATIINKSDRSDAEIAQWLERAYGIRNPKPTRDILVGDYDRIERAILAPGSLPEGRA